MAFFCQLVSIVLVLGSFTKVYCVEAMIPLYSKPKHTIENNYREFKINLYGKDITVAGMAHPTVDS